MMDQTLVQKHIEKLKAGHSVPKFTGQTLSPRLKGELRNCLDVLGPMPKRSLAAMADLGLTDTEIARYHMISRQCVSELRTLWHIHGQA